MYVKLAQIYVKKRGMELIEICCLFLQLFPDTVQHKCLLQVIWSIRCTALPLMALLTRLTLLHIVTIHRPWWLYFHCITYILSIFCLGVIFGSKTGWFFCPQITFTVIFHSLAVSPGKRSRVKCSHNSGRTSPMNSLINEGLEHGNNR